MLRFAGFVEEEADDDDNDDDNEFDVNEAYGDVPVIFDEELFEDGTG